MKEEGKTQEDKTATVENEVETFPQQQNVFGVRDGLQCQKIVMERIDRLETAVNHASHNRRKTVIDTRSCGGSRFNS